MVDIRQPEPETRTVELTDIDIRFPGETQQLTLRPEDSIQKTDEAYVVVFATGETVELSRQHILWKSERKSVVKEVVKQKEKK